jgi:preprotein translocase subunit SecE
MAKAKSAMLDGARDATGKARSALSWWGRSRTFLAQVRNEVERVTWPSRKEVQATTVVVILTSVAFGLYLWGADLVLDRIVRVLFTSLGAS